MSAIFYYFIIKPLSMLPYRLIYVLSDGLYQLVYHIIGYRRKVVLQNMRNSFPRKAEHEIIALEKRYYHHLCDLIMESLKNFNISAKTAKKRFRMINPEVIEEYYEKGRSVAIVGGHLGNWEGFALSIPLYFTHHTIFGLYTPMNNKFLDRKAKKSRSRFGTRMTDKSIIADAIDHEIGKNPIAPVFVGDQAPMNVRRAHWMEFLNQDTPVFTGTERYAKDFDMAVVYYEIGKVKRGFYTGELKTVTDNPLQTADNEITEMHTRMLEASIMNEPAYWLWSHRRWKRKRPEK